MATANIIIRQGDLNTTPGSRDNLVISSTITLLNNDNTGVSSWSWTLIAKPEGSSATLSTPTASTSGFTPDKYGTYLIRLIINSGEDSDQVGAGIKTANYQYRMPAAKETTEFGTASGWANAINDALLKIDDGYLGEINTLLNSKGDILTHNGTTLSVLDGTSATNGYVLTFDNTQSMGLKWAAAGASISTIQDVYNNSSNPVRITQDNTRDGIFLQANSNNDDPLTFEDSTGTDTLSVLANGNVRFRVDNRGIYASSGTEYIIGNAGAGGWIIGGHLLPNTDTYTLGAASGRWLDLFTGQDNLGTTTGTAILTDNQTAATIGNQQVSPAIALEGRGWSTGSSVSRTVGVRLYNLPIQGSEPLPSLVMQFQDGNGAYTTRGTIGEYTTGTGIKFGEADAMSEYMSINGPVTGFQFVVAGASECFITTSGISGTNSNAVLDLNDAAGSKLRYTTNSYIVIDSNNSTVRAAQANGATAIGLIVETQNTWSTAGASLIKAYSDSTAGAQYIGLLSGTAGYGADGEDLVTSGTVAAGDVVVWTGTDGKTIATAGASANLTTIAGVAVTGAATGNTIKVARRGRVLTNAEAGVPVGALVGTSGSTAGRCTAGAPGAGAIIGRAVTATGTPNANTCYVDLVLG